jgi:hypothetical protein
LFVFYLLAILLSVLLQSTDSTLLVYSSSSWLSVLHSYVRFAQYILSCIWYK